jgi:hypothetical protein
MSRGGSARPSRAVWRRVSDSKSPSTHHSQMDWARTLTEARSAHGEPRPNTSRQRHTSLVPRAARAERPLGVVQRPSRPHAGGGNATLARRLEAASAQAAPTRSNPDPASQPEATPRQARVQSPPAHDRDHRGCGGFVVWLAGNARAHSPGATRAECRGENVMMSYDSSSIVASAGRGSLDACDDHW